MTNGTKPSGIWWIGDIPENWNVKRIKYIANLKGRIGWQGLTSDEYTDVGAYLITGVDFKNGRIDWDKCVHVPIERWREARDIQIKNGDLLITKDGTVGKVAIVDNQDKEASLNSGVLRIVTQENYDRKFLFWVLQSDVFWTWFNYKNSGNSTIIHLYQGDFAEFKYAIPPLPEQKAIANFLDKQCAKSDSIIFDMEQQVEVLQKYKRSLIFETVTKGLDATISMKESGIKWIGDIPNHWEVGRLKNLFLLQRGYDLAQSDFVANGVPVYGSNGLIGYHDSITTKAPNVTIGRSGSIGEVNYIEEDFWAHNTAIFAKDLKGNNAKYIYYILKSIDIKSLGNGSAVPTLDRKNVQNVHFPYTTNTSEQQGIVDFLDEKCEKIDTIIAEKKQSITKMNQYKKSIIYEYVTGKKRLKGVEEVCQ
ncbi:restriction endonuclease subunit S [Lysinibacillus fusiformis]|uniref:restriction endonuclease subunit S n=1 Tax=Lysinibacillus fusiformis TaxID=28031 RepID=UPI00201BF871|nr:restriction endonuclease subunit S [Lysinibacillus fusiformis]